MTKETNKKNKILLFFFSYKIQTSFSQSANRRFFYFFYFLGPSSGRSKVILPFSLTYTVNFFVLSPHVWAAVF